MDFQELKAKHPEVFEAVKAEGRKEAEASVNDKISQAKAEGAKAEAERVRGIEALALPGAEAIIAQAKLDPTQTAQTVSMLIIENQKKALAERANATTTDAEALAKKAAELSASSSSAVDPVEAAEEKKAIDAMVAGLNSKK